MFIIVSCAMGSPRCSPNFFLKQTTTADLLCTLTPEVLNPLTLYFKDSLTFDHSQVHDHLLVIEDPIDVHPAAVQTTVCPPHI